MIGRITGRLNQLSCWCDSSIAGDDGRSFSRLREHVTQSQRNRNRSHRLSVVSHHRSRNVQQNCCVFEPNWQTVSNCPCLASQLVTNRIGHAHLVGVDIQSNRVVVGRIEINLDVRVLSLPLQTNLLTGR